MKHYLRIRLLILLMAVFQNFSLMAQRVIPETEVIELAMKNSAALHSSDLQVRQNRYLQRTGLSLPNPEVITESPTGEFYAVGVLQSLEFPSVYIKQNQLRKQITKLSETQRDISKQDVLSTIKTLYLDLQLAEARNSHLGIQDSLSREIAASAERQFKAGVIDYLVKTFTEARAGEIHNQLIQAREEYHAIRNQLKIFTGIADSFKTTPLRRTAYEAEGEEFDSSLVLSNPSIRYYQQLRNVGQKSLAVERNKALPGLVFGYLNQGAKETETYYRFRVGFTMPLWFWQYNGTSKAFEKLFPFLLSPSCPSCALTGCCVAAGNI